MKFVILLLMLFLGQFGQAQPIYNACNSALEICPNETYSLTNVSANKTFCPGCEDDFTFCFTSNNTIWLTFTTNISGGDVQIDFSNLVFETNTGQDDAIQATILEATVPCNSASYTAIGNCESNGSVPFSLNVTGLPPNSTFYILINGDLSGAGITLAAECTFDLTISGSGIDRASSSVSLTSSSTNICKNDIYTATAILTDCPDTTDFKWFINGTLVAQTTEEFFQTTDLSDGDVVSVETTCYTFCSQVVSSSTGAITVYTFPLDAGPDQIISPGQTTQLFGSTTAPDHVWAPSFSLNDPNSLTPLAFPANTTTYALSATENGCTLVDYVTVLIEESLIFPTTFSPNDDGINDTWEISGVDLYPNCFVRIFDRWGQEVFQSTGYSKSKAWDGMGNSGKMSEGVYFYIVELRDDEKREFKGSITLIR